MIVVSLSQLTELEKINQSLGAYLSRLCPYLKLLTLVMVLCSAS